MIIDAHVHYTPPVLRTELETAGEPYLQMLLNGAGSIQGWVSAETMLTHMDTAGIDKVLIVGEYFQRHENCVRRNSRVLELIRRYPDRMMAVAIVQPKAGRAALDELERCIAGGMIGVGELNPYAQGFGLNGDEFRPIAQFCSDHNLPIDLHVGEEIGRYYTGKSTTPLREYYELACRFPDLKLIFSHWGGGILFYEIMPHVRKRLKNVWYNTAASPLLYPTKRIFQTALTCIDPSKILYASDYPLMIYPRKMSEPDFAPFLDVIRKQQLGTEIEAGVFGRNFTQMLAFDHMLTSDSRSDRPIPVQQTEIDGSTTVRDVLDQFPETEGIFGRNHLPTHDTALPAWEPIEQAAAARGLSASEQQQLLTDLNETANRSQP